MNQDRDWKSDPVTGELVIENGDIAMVSGIDSIRQDLEDRLSLVRGEWFLDATAGVPLFESVLVKNASAQAIGSVYRKAILATLGVTGIQSLTAKIDRRARTASIDFVAETDEGAIVMTFAPDLGIDAVLDNVAFGLPLYA